MTLIAASLSPTSVTVVSDILLSMNAPRHAVLPLPGLHPACGAKRPSQHALSLSQKTILLSDRVLISWSGEFIKAEALVADLATELRINRDLSAADVKMFYERRAKRPEDLTVFCIILRQSGIEFYVSPKCAHIERDNNRILVAGSGKATFLARFAPFPRNKSIHEYFMSRFTAIFGREWKKEEPFKELFGSWFEVTIGNTTSGFKKLTSARLGIDFVGDKPHAVGAVEFCDYIGDTLAVTQYNNIDKSWSSSHIQNFFANKIVPPTDDQLHLFVNRSIIRTPEFCVFVPAFLKSNPNIREISSFFPDIAIAGNPIEFDVEIYKTTARALLEIWNFPKARDRPLPLDNCGFRRHLTKHFKPTAKTSVGKLGRYKVVTHPRFDLKVGQTIEIV